MNSYSVKFVILLLLLSFPVLAQKPIKVDFLPFFEKVTGPPSSAKDAYDKTHIGNDEYGNPKYNSELPFKELSQQLEKYLKDINADALKDAMPTGDQMDMAKKMSDPKFQEKLKNMSQEEKMKWAMEMAKNSAPKATTETPAVIKTFQDASALNQAKSAEVQNAATTYQKESNHTLEIENKHKAIEDWQKAEIEKLPDLTTGEMSYKDPKAVKKIKLQAADKNIAVVNEELKYIGAKWNEHKSKEKIDCSPFLGSLAKCHYGDDARGNGMVKVFANAQASVITSIITLIAESSKAYDYAARYYLDKLKVEKEKVD